MEWSQAFQQLLTWNCSSFPKKTFNLYGFDDIDGKLTKCLDNDECIIGVFFDFSKTFDKVDHATLL